jgi:hypothetical protein
MAYLMIYLMDYLIGEWRGRGEVCEFFIDGSFNFSYTY